MPVSRTTTGNKRARKLQSAGRAPLAKRRKVASRLSTLARRITSISRSIETKEACRRVTNVQLAHNNVTVLNNSLGAVFNPFEINTGGGEDPMVANSGQRIGDKIQIKGMLFKFFVEGALSRSKVYFRFMLIKMAKGDTLNRTTLFKGASGNKMIDQINTERFTIVSQKIINVSPPNTAPTGVQTLPPTGITTGSVIGITGNKILSMYVPGKKFGRDGVVTYENLSNTQIKFYDYRLCCVAYDWYGTPQDVNDVGFINDGFVKVYFKDA